MKLRHAAALALVGWYLMVPPYGENLELDLNAPLSKWIVYSGHDTAKECEEMKIDQWKRLNKVKTAGGSDHRHEIINSQCIASDDPRLKEPSKR